MKFLRQCAISQFFNFCGMKRFIVFCVGIISLASVAIARPSLEFDKDRIEAGGTFELRLVVPTRELDDSREVPHLEMKDGFTLLGIDSVDARGGDFFSGPYKVRKYVFKMRAPKKTGKFSVGPLTWNIGGKNYELSPSINISLQKSFNDAAVNISLSASQKTVYEGEQFSVTLGIHTYEHFAGGLVPQTMDLGNDFIIHRSDLKDLELKRVPNTNEAEASAKFAWLAATKSGDLSIPKFSFKYTKLGEPKVVEENKSFGGATMSFKSVKQEQEEAEAQTPVLKIKVLPLPAGAPEDFAGMVGSYSFSADFDKTNLKVGDALTLALTIKGDGKPGTISEPKLPDFSEFRAVPPENKISKKVTGNKVITTKEIKVFLYPKRKGTFEIPAITYSWFNPSKKKYETASAGPWTIEVEKGDLQTVQVPVTASGEIVATAKQEIETLGSDIRFIKDVKQTRLSKPLYRNPVYFAAVLLAIPFYIISILLLKRRRKRHGDAGLMRQSKANKNYNAALAQAENALKQNDSKAFYAALETALIGYLSDNTNLEFRGMVKGAREEALRKWNVKDETIAGIEAWLEKCASARFMPSSDTSKNAQDLVEFKKFVEGIKV